MERRIAIALVAAVALGLPEVRAEVLESAVVATAESTATYAADGVVEPVRQSAIAAQVPARIVEITVSAGAAVTAGQILVRLDPRAAQDQVAVSRAEAGAAEAAHVAARREYDRSRRLFDKRYISQAAMDEAEARFKAAEAGVRATRAQTGIASTQSTYTTLTAPYAGIVAAVNVERGDLATAGVPLLTLYDPLELRVVAALPESVAPELDTAGAVRIEIGGASFEPIAHQLLPTSDPATHTRELRLTLPPAASALAPGQFARAWLPRRASGPDLPAIPRRAVVRRPEFDGVYVLRGDGRVQLRQVRLGPVRGEDVEVLAGVLPGERIALDPVAAARQ